MFRIILLTIALLSGAYYYPKRVEQPEKFIRICPVDAKKRHVLCAD